MSLSYHRRFLHLVLFVLVIFGVSLILQHPEAPNLDDDTLKVLKMFENSQLRPLSSKYVVVLTEREKQHHEALLLKHEKSK